MRRRTFLERAAAAAALAALPAGARAAARRPHRFRFGADAFELDGRPIVLRSGSMHYPRVPRPYWRDRLRKLRALGLNALCTYVFWNEHEARPGEFDFSGQRDVAAYLRAAQEEGLWVLLRPGPYVCSEWDFGGFPAWLLATDGIEVRSRDPRFLAAAGRYFDRLAQELAPLEAECGGPILMVQVENEYGSYGQDLEYLGAIRDLIRQAGFRAPLYTSNGPGMHMLRHGTLPDCASVINFGDGDSPEKAFAVAASFRPGGPRMCGEYWDGWFDHWGEHHHTTAPARAAQGLDWMLSRGISCNLYMAHGGTSFGFMAGANFDRNYQPDTTSYDYDAPLDEAGRPTPKFYALQAVLRKHLAPGERLPELPPPLPAASIPWFDLTGRAPLTQLLTAPRSAARPLPMEALGQSYGLVWYRTTIASDAAGTLVPQALRGYARVYQAGRLLGEIDRSRGQSSLDVSLRGGEPLDIVVECMGRVNFGPHLPHQRQGITDRVLLNGRELTGWAMVPLPLDDLSGLQFAPRAGGEAPGPAFYRASFTPPEGGDCFLDLRGWGKGYVWVNGRNLGRYWERGPQRSLYLPGCWLRPGPNEVIVFDWDANRPRRLRAAPEPMFD
jgi:beta-galactosidase